MARRMFNGATDELAIFVADDFRRLAVSFVQREIDTHAIDLHDLSFILHQTLESVISEAILRESQRLRANEKLAEIIFGTNSTEEPTE